MSARKIKIRLLCLLMILFFSGLAFGYTADGIDFQYRKDITIDSSLIDSTLSYFPVLVKLTSSVIDFDHFLHGTNDGYDIRFSDSIDGNGDANGAILDYEREGFDKAGSVAEIWVEIPSIPTSPDTTFYMFYGNTNCPDGEDIEHTWDGGTDASPLIIMWVFGILVKYRQSIVMPMTQQITVMMVLLTIWKAVTKYQDRLMGV